MMRFTSFVHDLYVEPLLKHTYVYKIFYKSNTVFSGKVCSQDTRFLTLFKFDQYIKHLESIQQPTIIKIKQLVVIRRKLISLYGNLGLFIFYCIAVAVYSMRQDEQY